MVALIRLSKRLTNCHVKRQLCSSSRLSYCTNSVSDENNYNDHLKGRSVRIGCSSGFWGDTSVSVPQLLRHGKLDYLVMDYLSEITMSLLTGIMKKTKGEGGFVPDFLQTAMAPYLKDIRKSGVKIISNGGGQNPKACGHILHEAINKAGLDLKVAVITGDDLMDKSKQLAEEGIQEMYSGASFPQVVTSINAYLGAGPIAKALSAGADIVITGRCVDSALVLGPLLNEFQWPMTDFDKLAMGSLAGHLVECGAQVTGGIFTDWQRVPDWANIGFPIVECASDGNFVVTKPPETGGLVSAATVSEQLLYEIGDPTSYHLPDVVCDFTQVKLQEVKGEEGNAVYVTGARGKPPSSKYKVCCTYADGYKLRGAAIVGGPRSIEKANRTMDEIISRCTSVMQKHKLEDFSKLHTEVIGSADNAVMFLGAQHKNKEALQILSTEIAPAGTGMAPGLTGLIGGRPNVSMVHKLYSFLMDKTRFNIDLYMNSEHIETYSPEDIPTVEYTNTVAEEKEAETDQVGLRTGNKTYTLEQLAYTRSGDKGNHANIGVIARHPDLLPYIRAALTEEAVANHFAEFLDGELGPGGKQVQRYDVPGIHGLNFMLYNSLGGGGVSSLRSDPQGKAYGQRLLTFELTGLPDLDPLIES